MDQRLAPANISADELPSGFTAAEGMGAASQPNNEAKQREAQKQSILEQAMTPDALARLRRIKLVKAEKAAAVENLITSMAMQGKLPGRINEGRLIEMLEGLVGAASQASSRGSKISIQRKKYAFDSDDDDNDDDLM